MSPSRLSDSDRSGFRDWPGTAPALRLRNPLGPIGLLRSSGVARTLLLFPGGVGMRLRATLAVAGAIQRELREGICRVHGLKLESVPVSDFGQIIPRWRRSS